MKAFIFVLIGLFCSTLLAKVEVKLDDADSYISKRQKNAQVRAITAFSPQSHYLALHAGGFFEDKTYNWGSEFEENVGGMSLGFTYRMGEWVNSSDFMFRVDYTAFDVGSGRSTKLSFLPSVSFPDANSGFPLYFGAGIGPGVYFKQLDGESSLSLDYQLFAGARFYNVFESIGLTFESGLKNHINVLSDGQFNGVFFTLGTVFIF